MQKKAARTLQTETRANRTTRKNRWSLHKQATAAQKKALQKMSKRRRTTETPVVSRKTWDRLPSVLQDLVSQYGRHSAQQQPVSRDWWQVHSKRCREATRDGSQCVGAQGFRAECSEYCIGAGVCARWLEALLENVRRVRTFRDDNRGQGRPRHSVPPTKVGLGVTWDVDPHAGESGIRLTLADNGGRWLVTGLGAADIVDFVNPGPSPGTIDLGLWTEEGAPAVRVRGRAANLEAVLADSRAAARLVCATIRAQRRHRVVVSVNLHGKYSDAVPSGEAAPGELALFDADGKIVEGLPAHLFETVRYNEMESKQEVEDSRSRFGGHWHLYIDTQSAHDRGCAAAPCLVGGQLSKACRSFCLDSGRYCTPWADRLLSVVDEMRDVWIALPGEPAASRHRVAERSLSVLHRDGTSVLHLLNKGDHRWHIEGERSGTHTRAAAANPPLRGEFELADNKAVGLLLCNVLRRQRKVPLGRLTVDAQVMLGALSARARQLNETDRRLVRVQFVPNDATNLQWELGLDGHSLRAAIDLEREP